MKEDILFDIQKKLETIQSEISTTSPKDVVDKLGGVIDGLVVQQKGSVTGKRNHLFSLEADEIRHIIQLIKRTEVKTELDREIRVSLFDKLRDFQ